MPPECNLFRPAPQDSRLLSHSAVRAPSALRMDRTSTAPTRRPCGLGRCGSRSCAGVPADGSVGVATLEAPVGASNKVVYVSLVAALAAAALAAIGRFPRPAPAAAASLIAAEPLRIRMKTFIPYGRDTIDLIIESEATRPQRPAGEIEFCKREEYSVSRGLFRFSDCCILGFRRRSQLLLEVGYQSSCIWCGAALG